MWYPCAAQILLTLLPGRDFINSDLMGVLGKGANSGTMPLLLLCGAAVKGGQPVCRLDAVHFFGLG